MTQPDITQVNYWENLAKASEEDRRAEMVVRWAELVAMTEDERLATLKKMSSAAYELPDLELEALTRSRLLTWVEMDREEAKLLAAAFDESINSLSARLAMRRVAVSQTVSLKFTIDERNALAEIVPKVFDAIPGVERHKAESQQAAEAVGAAATESKPWWKFW